MTKPPGQNDYYSGKKKGEFNPKDIAPVDDGRRRWWTYEGTQCAQAVGSTVDFLQKAQAPRIRQQVINQSLYGNRRLGGAQAQARARLMSTQQGGRQQFITYNAVASIVDTATSKVGETKPRPYFLTSGGDYKQQRKAKHLNKYTEGVFYETKTYDLTPQAFRDAAIDGDGFIFVDVHAGKVRHEVVSGMELWLDEEEGQYGRPRNLFRCKVVDRDLAAACWPGSKKEIFRVPRAKDSYTQTVSDMVSIVEGWHMGSPDEAGDMQGGMHGIALLGSDGHMLLPLEDWPHDFFPFARMPWCLPPTGCGFWAQSLAEQLQGEQIELNKELQLVQRSMQLAGVLKILTPVGSKVVKEHINNDIGSVLMYAGNQAPQFFCPEPIHQSFFDNPNRIIERMYRKAGVSEMSASAKKAPGLNAGVAIREFEDIESERHKTTQRQYDALHLQLAHLDIMLSIDAASKGKLEAVRVPGKMAFDKVDFSKDLKGLKRSEFTLQCYSVSRLPRDPSGRLQTIQEHIQAGIISIRQGRKLLDFPDLESFETLADAQETIIQKVLDAIVDDGDYDTPEPTDDLSLAKEMVLEYIQHYRALDLEPERLDLLRTWNVQVDELTMQAMPPPPPAMPDAPPGMGPPQAAPMAPPQSDLLPNAPAAAA